jgi:hypothetical protein
LKSVKNRVSRGIRAEKNPIVSLPGPVCHLSVMKYRTAGRIVVA